MAKKRIISIILIVAVLAAFAFFAKNNAVAETKNTNPYQLVYNRVSFNINSKDETVPLAKIQQSLIKRQLRPLRVWVLINGDTTAMFAVQKNWNLSNLDKIIAANILSNYKNKVISIKKESSPDVKNLQEAKEIVKAFSNKPTVQITALDFPYNPSLKMLFKTSGINFTVSEIPYGNIIPSPELQWDLLHKKAEMQPSHTLSYDPHSYPDDSTWLPNYVSTDIRTLMDADETRYIDQETEWYSNSRLSYFVSTWNSTYEQDTVFWRNGNDCYVLYTSPKYGDTSMVESWYSNFPSAYLDSRLEDGTDHLTLTVGCAGGTRLQANKRYYYTIYAKKGNVSSGYELETDEQPGECMNNLPYPLSVFPLKTYVECQYWYVPNSYTWTH